MDKLTHELQFANPNLDPYDEVVWEQRTAEIKKPDGTPIFRQENVEFPKHFSQRATDIVASKYFYGDVEAGNGDPAKGYREYRLSQLISRVTETITEEGGARGYFASPEDKANFEKDLRWLLLHQHLAFNSPVWFNVGLGHKYGIREGDDENMLFSTRWKDGGWKTENVDPYMRPQASACFIVHVEDDIDSIWRTMSESARLFKFGSGVGADWSTLRSQREQVSGGGTASGPISFMKVQDATGGTIKSGGKTRRAAIMQILRDDHPDVFDFARVKSEEEAKAHALIDAGYDGSFNGEAYATPAFQNVNQSVRLSDAFFEAIQEDLMYATFAVTTNEEMDFYDPNDLLEEIAKGTHFCGDPGVQYDGPIQHWHTCPKSGRINGSNPCSEYLFLDDSACNLASINFRKVEKEDGGWNAEKLANIAEIATTAMDILCSMAGYPSRKIAENSERFRPLGLGFANLGATLMAHGIPYDSNEGRGIAAALQSVIHFAGYKRSARLAKAVGAFDGYTPNRKDFIRVMKQHGDALEEMVAGEHQLSDHLMFNKEALSVAMYGLTLHEDMMQKGTAYGWRNAQATVIAPTGTISFFLDCDTTGIEPSPALVQYKKLAGKEDSTIKIVNETVNEGLESLGYSEKGRNSILGYIETYDTIEDCPLIIDEDLPVFDCAIPPMKGERSIHHMGHIRMMAAVQPFVSGAISKTCNLPEDATVEDIADTYFQGWKLGLKALAIYRDGSKRSQPVNTSDDSDKTPIVEDETSVEEVLEEFVDGFGVREILNCLEEIVGDELPHLPQESAQGDLRRKVPKEASAIRKKFQVGDVEGFIHVGLFEDDTPGEVFVNVSKAKPTIAGLLDQWAIALSIGLQYGVPLEKYVSKFKGVSFKPSGFTGGDDVCRVAQSVVDYVARYLEARFLKSYGSAEAEEISVFLKDAMLEDARPEDVVDTDRVDEVMDTLNGSNSPCPNCGTPMIPNGACETCPNCGTATGCG